MIAVGTANAKVIVFGEYAVLHGIAGYAVALKDFRLEVQIDLKDKEPSAVEQDVSFILENCRVTSNIPIGSGLGSSAALSVAIARALKSPNVEATAKSFEDHFHAGSSGIDTFTVANGGLCRLRNGNEFLKLENEALKNLTGKLKFSLIDTKHGRKVASVKAAIDPVKLTEYCAAIALISKAFSELLSFCIGLNQISPLMNSAQDALVALGVSNEQIDQIVTKLRSVFPSIGIKITGAGFGGCLLVVHDESVSKEALLGHSPPSTDLYYDIQFQE